ncbi:MAG: hypothetical protein OER86_03835 [Phycisphaerae bacterium]|nr:hypothetical protein [Phycisphaerae bacterium]
MRLILSFLITVMALVPALAAEPGEPPVRAPYPNKLDRAATNKWWEVARAAREGKLGSKRHPKSSKTVTGRHFLDLERPRDQVVAFALYTVQNGTLKMSAQLHPLFPDERREVRLEVKDGDNWKQIATAKVNDLGWSALFRVENWDDGKTVAYRVRHGEKASFAGSIRKNPVDKDVVIIASLSCNSSRDRMGRPKYIRNLKALDPDVLFFAGDQHYDHTEHTAGWIMWGTQFKDVIRDRPTVTIPDDHDVGQANLWGESGKIASHPNGNTGGYFYHPQYVKQVERCQTAHLPDPIDPKPISRGIGVYFTNLNVGGVDFAIIEDRKFKSGPNGKIPKQGPRPDHIRNPEYNPKSVDMPGLVLLGQRQLKYLNYWSTQWKGVQMKAMLSQTPFAGAAHLHGGGHPEKNRLHADLDSNGWPQTGRNNALRAIRKGFAVHLAGDQHLSTLLQHGIDEYDDGPWSLVSPAIVNTIYGRYWHPADERAGTNRPTDSSLSWTGRYLDGFHNKVTMHAYVNARGDNGKADGFVAARFNKKTRTITAESWPRNQDMSKPGAKPYPGWGKVIPQIDNYNPPSWGKLAKLTFNVDDPVVQLIDDKGAVLYTLRINGRTFTPHAPKDRTFVIKAGIDSPDRVVVESAAVGTSRPTAVMLP